MKRIYVLTNFTGFLKSFSPIIVVGEQLKMMIRAGYEPVLIVSDGWDPPEDSIFAQVKTEYTSPVSYQNMGDGGEQFEMDVETLFKELNDIIVSDKDGFAVVITHDLIFLPDYTKHHVAARKLAQARESIRWLHWVHSATNPHQVIEERSMYAGSYKDMLNTPFPNSLVCYPNAYDIPRVAVNFHYEENQVVEVPHSTDPTEGMHPLVQRLYDEYALGDCQVLMVYPLRLDRGKNAEKNVLIMGGCARAGISAKLIFCDFQSTGDDKLVYRDDLKKLANEQGVGDEVIFLSEFDESANLEVPHQVVLDLFTLSNVFCLPSKSETYSLVAQEAMLKGNLCILNQNFSPMRQIYGKAAIYRPFSANIGIDGLNGETTTTYNNPNEYFEEVADNIKYWLENDKALLGKTWVRTQRNPDFIFRNFIKPLLARETKDAA